MAQKPKDLRKVLTNLYIDVYKFAKNDEYERSIKICNKILLNYPQETLAYHCKVVALIHLSKFEEALNLMKNNEFANKRMHFERGYCLYRCNKEIEAIRVLEQAEPTFKICELKGQIMYHGGRFPDAFECYQYLAENLPDDYIDERQTNMSACLVYSPRDFSSLHSDKIPEDTYEVYFNKASMLIEQGQYSEAEKKLRVCEKLWRESLEEDGLSEDEIQLELAHVKVQLAYIYQKQGRTREAHQLYNANLKLKLEDVSLAAVASNNAILLNKDQNVFDSKKKLKVLSNDALQYKLTERQQRCVALNKSMFHYRTGQSDACLKICDSIDEKWPNMSIHTVLIRACILMKSDKNKEAVKLLKEYESKCDEDKFTVKLFIAQIELIMGNRENACKILESMGVNRYRPAVIGALITLYLAEGKQDVAQNIYKDAVEWYRANKKAEGDLTKLWKQAADFHLRSGQPQVAADSLEELLRENPDDKRALGQLVAAYAEFNKSKAIALAKKLGKEESLSEGIDKESVESSAWLSAKKVPNSSPAVSSTPSTESLQIVKKKKHRKRKGKLPKDYDPKVTPDPERWLPKYERTGYRKKRDKRAKEIIKGSQGSASSQSELFDYSGKFSTDTESQESPRVEPSPAPKHQQQKNKGQKKKNKKK